MKFIDEAIIQWLCEQFQRAYNIDLRKDQMALQRLKEAAEKAKIELSSAQQTAINLPFITMDQTGPKHLSENLTRAKFEQLGEKLFERTRTPVLKCLKDAKLAAGEIDEVVLVGGSTRIPKVQTIVKEIGSIARPKNVWIVQDMPKTRSGKIMRRVIAAVSNFADIGDVTTLANPEIVEEIRHNVQSDKLSRGETPRELTDQERAEIAAYGQTE